MAADILLHRASKVPVGKDQEQHLEMTRNFAQRFNHMYKVDYFPEPIAYNFGNNLVKVPGLDGSTKMSKSDNENSCIYLADSADVIRKKVMRAVSDSGPTVPNQPKAQAVENLFSLLKIVSSSDTIHFFEEQYAQCSIRYGDLKKQLAEDMVNFCAPIRERILEIDSNQAFLIKVAQIGAEKARESAQKTMKEVREIIGFRSL
jgi:tryptophanyl-tRNA synthetase